MPLSPQASAPTKAYRTCSLCEAACGLEITVADGVPTGVRGDADDVLSQGFLCPKGASIHGLHLDPDRIREPLAKQPDGSFRAVSWEEAFALADRLITPVIAEHGRDAVATYVGNPSGHDLSAALYHRSFHRALGSRRLFTVGTVDQLPKSLSCALMFGTSMAVPVPDVDRAEHVMILGANPVISQGSMVMAPNLRGRLKAVLERGGKLVVIDPRRTRTAQVASEHHFIRPGTDAFLLAGMVHTLLEEGLARPGRLADHLAGLDELAEFAARFPPERAAAACGVAADEIRRLARELAQAERAVLYGRIGTTTQRFGSAASWLIDVVNVLTGNLDAPGGAMFTRPVAGGATATDAGFGRGVEIGRWRSAVRGAPEVLGELPVAVLPEEITQGGEDRVRALFQFAGNPVLSNPDGAAVDHALGQLDVMIAHDFYLNETTRHADVIFPATSPLERSVYPIYVYPTAIRNVANYSPPVLPLSPGRPPDWQVVLRLAAIVRGEGPDADPAAIDDEIVRRAAERATRDPDSPLHGRDVDAVLDELAPRTGPERLLDLKLRSGPYGTSLDALQASPHGLDFGALEPRIPGILRTPSGKIELAPPLLVAEGERMEAEADELAAAATVLVGRRELRSINSWMHNVENLAGGKRRCTLIMHPTDARAAGVGDGDLARVASRVGAVEIHVELSEDIMQGVVSAPHGWGHEREGTQNRVAVRAPGVNVNRLTDPARLDPLSGTAVLNGIPVTVTPAVA